MKLGKKEKLINRYIEILVNEHIGNKGLSELRNILKKLPIVSAGLIRELLFNPDPVAEVIVGEAVNEFGR